MVLRVICVLYMCKVKTKKVKVWIKVTSHERAVDADAQNSLSCLYALGQGVEGDNDDDDQEVRSLW